MATRSRPTWIVASLVSLLVFVRPAPADLVNGDFSSDLSVGWTVAGGVERWDEAARFYGDEDGEGYDHSTLTQVFTLDPLSLILSFDVLMTTGGGETDYFTASLDGTTFYTRGSDFGGETFAETFTYDVSSLAGTTVELAFDLEHDYTDGYITVVSLDNVAVSLIPTPGAVLLGSIGLSFSGWLLRKRRMLSTSEGSY